MSNIGARLDRLPISRFHYRLMAMIGVGMVFDGFDIYMLSGIIAAIVKNGFATTAMVADLVSLSFAGLFLGALVSGLLSDHYGRRTLFVWNMLIYSVASILCAVSPTFWLLMAMRLLSTFGLGGEIAVGYSVFGEFIPPSKRGRWSNALFLLTNLSFPLAPLPSWGC